MASSSSSSAEKYGQPLSPLINVGNFVSVKLSTSNYDLWERQMYAFIESLDSIGFIDGTVASPVEKVWIPDGTGTTGQVLVTNEDHVRWRKIDRILQGWILGSLTEEVLSTVVAFNSTAEVLWIELRRKFGHLGEIVKEKEAVEETQETELSVAVEETQEKELSAVSCLDLCNILLAGNLKGTQRFIHQHPAFRLTTKIASGSQTALHLVIGTKKGNDIVRYLVPLMTPDALAMQTTEGNTALSFAAMVGNTEAVRILVSKDPTLLYIKNDYNILPVHMAAEYAHRDTLSYLFNAALDHMLQGPVSNTPFEDQYIFRPFEGQSGVKLLVYVIVSGFFDIALTIVQHYPDLATVIPNRGDSPLTALVRNSSQAFPRGTHLYARGKILSARVFEGKSKIVHQQVLKLLRSLCNQIKSLNDRHSYRIQCEKPIILATKLGIHEVVEEIVSIFPNAIWSKNEEGHYIFQLAIRYRCETVFNLIYQMSGHKHSFSLLIDDSGNNILHLVAKLAPPHKLNLIPGPALQMQRELQWFKEVEKFVIPACIEQENASQETPAMLFTKEHSKLVVEGEKWMKDTANACIITTALIATVTFAAAITTPGGNGGEGSPIFLKRLEFKLFLVADSISLLASTTSLMMFLSILTARYAQEDFLYALPKRLTIGLSMLSLSVISMMIASGFTIYLIFNSKPLALIPIFICIFVPIVSFLGSHFRLLLEVISSTYGRSIFGKQSDKPFY